VTLSRGLCLVLCPVSQAKTLPGSVQTQAARTMTQLRIWRYGDSLVSAVAGINGLIYIMLRDQYHNVLWQGQPGHPSSRNVAVTYTKDARMTWPNGGKYYCKHIAVNVGELNARCTATIS
jgi:hypothetical protein